MNQYQPQKRQKNCWSDVVKSWPEEMIGEREGRKIGKETRMFFSSDAETPICVHTRSSCNALTRTLAFQCLQSLVFGKLPFCLLAADGFQILCRRAGLFIKRLELCFGIL